MKENDYAKKSHKWKIGVAIRTYTCGYLKVTDNERCIVLISQSVNKQMTHTFTAKVERKSLSVLTLIESSPFTYQMQKIRNHIVNFQSTNWCVLGFFFVSFHSKGCHFIQFDLCIACNNVVSLLITFSIWTHRTIVRSLDLKT